MQVIEGNGRKNVTNLIKNKGEEFVRHGDVLLVRVHNTEEIKDKAGKLVATGTNIVQKGELTGHAHRLSSRGSAQTEIFANIENPDERFVAVMGEEGAMLTHEEHKQVNLDEGLYKVVIEREFDPTTELTQRVYD